MVCCILIAGILGLLSLPFMRRRNSPLAWRLQTAGSAQSQRSALSIAPQSRFKSFGFAMEGIAFVIRGEANMRIHILAAILVVGLGLLLQISAEEWRWLIFAITLVMAAEAVNTAIEQCCNAISTEFRPAIKVAKDVAAGAVLICAIGAGLLGLSIFVPHVLAHQHTDMISFDFPMGAHQL